MSNGDLFSKRNKFFVITGFIGFSILIILLGRFVLRSQAPSVLKETKPEISTSRPNFKSDLKMFGELYGIEKDKLLLPEFVDLPQGKFLMGSSTGAITEQPQHEVIVDAFSITRTEVTNTQYLAFCEITKRNLPQDPRWQGLYMRDYPNHPIVGVSWQDAMDYAAWLGTILGKEVRLPTEAEWEYAAQGAQPGTTLEFAARELLPTTKVASYPPNPSGLFDMLGNVWEWCLDWHTPQYYTESPKENPTGPTEGEFKVIRGGSWAESINVSRISHRNRALPKGGSPTIGFRVVISQKPINK
ncbi:MAG: formylglycine-generating enzyme family protein [Acidobacteria bacterium]|nr:formylglycine-generating enzyme family protein [Acidobacteriota bacterium]